MPRNNRRNRRSAAPVANDTPVDTPVANTVSEVKSNKNTASKKANKSGAKAAASKKTVVEKTATTETSRSKLSPEERTRRHLQSRVSGFMRRNEDTFKAVSLVLDLLAASEPEDKRAEAVASMWSKVTRYDKKYFNGVYKKRRNANSPLRIAKVKSPSTAYAFFTQEKYTPVKEANPTSEFGAISRVIRKMWKELPEDQKQRYTDLAAQDSARYHKAKAHVYGLLDGSVKAKSKADKDLYALLKSSLESNEESVDATTTTEKSVVVKETK